MFASIKSFFKFGSAKNIESKKHASSLLLVIFINILEDVFFWKKMWISLLFFVFFNILFMVCLYRLMSLVQFIFGFSILITSIDGFECWLKYKHRTSCLKRLANQDSTKIVPAFYKFTQFMERKLIGFVYLRDRNPTKAFLLLQIALSIIFFIGKYTSGYTLIYILFSMLFFLHKLIPLFMRILRKIQQNAESDFELEDLIPDDTDINLDLLSIEPDPKPLIDERQSLDYWKPEDLPLEEVSDSSDNSSSLVRNLSIEKMQTLNKDVEGTDSSEDEYLPQGHQQLEQYQSTLEVQPGGTWSSSAYNVLSNIKSAVTNMVHTPHDLQDVKKRKRVPSGDSSDGFVMIEKDEF